MEVDKSASGRSSPNAGGPHDRTGEGVSVTRPVARRMSGLSVSRGPDNSSALPTSGNAAAPNAQEQRASAWTKYPKAASSSSPPPEQAVPPPDTEATLATQAAAQQMWESHAAAESDNTASTTPPPESPTQPTTATAEQQQPQPDTLHAMLEGLGNLAGNPPTNQQAQQLHELYMKTLKAALLSSGLPPAAVNAMASAPVEAAAKPTAPPAKQPEQTAQDVKKEGREPAYYGTSAADGSVARPKAERVNPANGSLSILPEPARPGNMHYPDTAHSLPPPSARMPPPSPFHPPQNSAPPASQPTNLQPQQVVELLGEILRAQTSASGPMQHTSLPQEQPPLVMNNSSAPYPNFRYNSQETRYGDSPSYPAGMDSEAYKNMAARRWNSAASLTSDSSLYNNAGTGAGNLASLASLPQNLTGAESQALLQALQQKYQASEMENMANITIQAILASSASRDAQGMRKRKLPDMYEEQSKRHNSLLSEGESYQYVNGQQQICTECGTTNTPTWRRSGKRLMCNACGLRRSRSMRSARSASTPLNAQSISLMEHSAEEAMKMQHTAM